MEEDGIDRELLWIEWWMLVVHVVTDVVADVVRVAADVVVVVVPDDSDWEVNWYTAVASLAFRTVA